MKRFAIIASILINTVIFPLQAQERQVLDKVVAKVDDYIILKSDVEKGYRDYLASGRYSGSNTRCEVLQDLVVNKLLVAKAEIDSIYVNELEVMMELDQRIRYFISQIGSEEALEQFYGKTIDEFKAELKDMVHEQLVVRKMEGIITSEISITPREVKQFFNKIPKDSLPYFSTEVVVAQIVKKPEMSRESKERMKRRLMGIRDRIMGGEEFGRIASLYSEEPGAKQSGGNIGWFNRGELAPEYEAAALKLKPGEVSMPVETQFGFHIIQLIERRGNEFNTRHVLLRPRYSDEDIRLTMSFLDSLRTSILSGETKFETAAKEHSDDMNTASSGGQFLDPQSNSNKISVDDLDPTIFFTIDTMKVGNITKPLKFQERDGSEAFRIIYYKERIKPHKANLNQDYQKIRAAAINQKKAKALDKWFEEAIREIFIEIDSDYDHCDIMK